MSFSSKASKVVAAAAVAAAVAVPAQAAITSPASAAVRSTASASATSVPVQVFMNAQPRPGDHIYVSGSGFNPNERVRITGLGAPQVSEPVFSYGLLLTRITFPADLKPGTYPVTFKDSSHSVTYYWYVDEIRPHVTPTAWYGHAGDTIGFNGDGFMSGEKVTLRANGKFVSSVNATSISGMNMRDEGRLPMQMNYTVPKSQAHSLVQFVLHGEKSGKDATFSIWFD